MKNFFKVFICAAMIFSFSSANVSAAVYMSDDDIPAFIAKCNQELKQADPNNNLDAPKISNVRKTYTETSTIAEGIEVTVTYTTINDKMFGIEMKTAKDKYNDNVKAFFEGMGIVYLKALGLSESDARELIDTKSEKFISSLNKNFVVKAEEAVLKIFATNPKQN